MSLAIPYTFIGGVGNKARASEVNANFQAVAAKFTEGAGGIADGDISTAAAIKGTKLSNVAGNRVPTDRLEDDAVDKDKLRDDATAGAPNAAVNSAAHIKDGIITKAKVLAATLTKAQMQVTEVTQAFSVSTLAANTARIVTVTPTTPPVLPVMGAMMPVSLTVEGVNANTEVVASLRDAAGVTVYSLSVCSASPQTCTGTLRFRYVAAS